MTNENQLNTGYIIIDSSSDFPSQAYRVIFYQWLGILKAKGVPKDHVLAWADFVNDITVQAPRPSPTGPRLLIPEGWEDRVRVGGPILDFTPTLASTMEAWGDDDGIQRIVIVVIGRGSEMGLRASDARLTPAGLGFKLCPCREKPVLIVLDFCESSCFAQQVAEESERDRVKCPVFFLSSGRSSSYKTAVVLFGESDVEPDVAPGKTHLRYARYSTMFHRPLLDLVAHSPGDELLEAVPERLRAFSAGGLAFDSVFLSVRAGGAHPRLREFFGGPLDRDAVLTQSGTRMRDILPERPEAGFLDDVGRFLSKEDEGCRVRLSRRFIRVNVRGGQVTLTGQGLLDWNRPDDQEVLRHIAYGPSMEAKVPAYEVEVTPIVNLMLIYLRSEEAKGKSKTASGAEEEEIFRRVVKFVRRQNGLPDARALDPLKPYLGFLRWPQWRDAITRVRHSILTWKVKGPLE